LGFEEPTELTEAEDAAREQRRRENIRIDQEYKATVAAQSSGHITVQPTATLDTKDDEYVAWVTDRGHLNAGYIDPSEPNHIATKYQIEASGDVLAPPTFLPPAPDAKKGAGILYIASEDGFVYAIDQATGDSVWRHSTGEPILERVALVFPHVYVCNQLGGMHCLDALTGERVWWAPKIKKFLAASEQYVYAIDIHERLVSLDRATGAWIDMMPLGPTAVALQNDRTDRVYLATESGLVQCLHQLGVDEPIRHNRVSPGAEQAADQGEAGPEAEQPTAQPAAPTQPAPAQPEPAAEEEPAADPFGGGGNPFGGANDDGGGNPFGGADTNPFGGDNPFAG
jgi:hypothetical protein